MVNHRRNEHRFTEADKEWHSSLLIIFSKFLKTKQTPMIVYDRRHFNKYIMGNKFRANQLWGECIQENGYIWLSPHHSSEPKTQIINTLFHECVHIKYPKWNEVKVRNFADKFMPVNINEDSKKPKFDQVHKRVKKQYRH